MKIGIDGSRAFIKDRTGTENYSYQLVKHLSLLDSDSFQSNRNSIGVDTQNHYLIYLRPGNEVNVKDWPGNFEFKFLNWPRLWTQGGLALQTFLDKINVLFVPAHASPIIHRPGLKIVVTVHDLGAEYLSSLHQLKQQLYLKYLTRYQYRSATKLIAVSEATRKDLINKAGCKSSQIEVIYEGIDREEFKVATDDAVDNTLKKFKLEREKYFFFVGTIQPRKNLERLIRAYQQFLEKEIKAINGKEIEAIEAIKKINGKNYINTLNPPNHLPDLVLAGSKGWLSDEIYALPKKLGIEDKVKFIGRVSNDELQSLLTGATALTFPSLFEGFGLPILEAFACGCPVITSKTSSMPEVAGKAAILVDPYKIDEIANALRFILNKDMRQKLVADGFKQVEKFSWEKCARETLRVLEKIGGN